MVATTTKKTRKELEDEDGLNTSIRSKQQAISYLTMGDYITPGKLIDLHILSHILLQFGISNKLLKLVMDGIRMVAFLMEDAYMQQIADSMAEIIKAQLSDHMKTFVTNIKNMCDTVEHVTGAAKAMMGKMDKFNDGFQELAEKLAQATQELTEKMAEVASRTQQQAAPTYAMALLQ
jgi:methyl-accepting chemotaxis protein